MRSVGLMQKLGMKLEGVQRYQGKDNDGDPAELYLYSPLAAYWKRSRAHGGSSSCVKRLLQDAGTEKPERNTAANRRKSACSGVLAPPARIELTINP